jgi:hypothetical protein
MNLIERIALPGPKRLLALDGGGIRGLISLEILAQLEKTLQQELEAGDDFRLTHYFDYVAGTSTGAIIATCIALGMSVDEIMSFYLVNGEKMFEKASLLRRFHYRYEDENLGAMLQSVFDAYVPADERSRNRHLTLGSAALQSLLLIVMRNATTDSAWPVSNNPFATFNDRARIDCNLDLPLWQLVRASTAAPTYFPPEHIRVGEEDFLFVDGGVTTYNNPAFLLFLFSTLDAYKLRWEIGSDKMLVVSVGTGTSPRIETALAAGDMTLLYNAGTVPSALMYAALTEQDLLCRVFGRCRFGDPLDLEVGDLIELGNSSRGLPSLFSYVRYNAELTPNGLSKLGLSSIQPSGVQAMDSIAHISDLRAVGRAVASRVKAEHFEGFLSTV